MNGADVGKSSGGEQLLEMRMSQGRGVGHIKHYYLCRGQRTGKEEGPAASGLGDGGERRRDSRKQQHL